MTSPESPEAVRAVRELRLVEYFQQQADYFADQFVGPCRHAERAELPVLFRDVDAASRGEPVFLPPHRLYDLVDLVLGHAVSGFLAGPWRHRPLVGVDVPVGQQVQFLVEQLPVQLRARQAFPAALAENAQHHFGWLHCASLMVINRSIACAPSPCGPALPVSRLGGRYPADYCGHSVAIELAFLRRSHVHTAIRTSTT
jgi:hypothetical protein